MSGFRIYLWAECAKLRRCRMLAVFVFGALLVAVSYTHLTLPTT